MLHWALPNKVLMAICCFSGADVLEVVPPIAVELDGPATILLPKGTRPLRLMEDQHER